MSIIFVRKFKAHKVKYVGLKIYEMFKNRIKEFIINFTGASGREPWYSEIFSYPIYRQNGVIKYSGRQLTLTYK